ncbi:hypothetical protein BDR03DRAFT_969980 [Suillus americanus]|nr:hypothetical protein BDR03DRAFT_969980 [Suillus americanus]
MNIKVRYTSMPRFLRINIPSRPGIHMLSCIPTDGAFMCTCGVLVPSMSQALYLRPVARQRSGDIGVFVCFCSGSYRIRVGEEFEKLWY